MAVYYNEWEPFCAQWLRNLIKAGHLPDGEVDERDIRDVAADDLRGFSQCHFFAGIGGWPYALRLAGWPDDRPVWTGSCPCQPFSVAGKRKGAADERHLWPDWFRLIQERKPAIIFGEQVARAIGHAWLDALAHDLEAEGYAVGAAVLPACAVSAPHTRERLWFVADSNGHRCQRSDIHLRPGRQDEASVEPCRNSSPLADTNGHEQHGRPRFLQMGWSGGESQAQDHAPSRRIEWPAEPDIPRVAHGVSERVAKLRALGNAIVPQVAAEFIKAFSELASEEGQ